MTTNMDTIQHWLSWMPYSGRLYCSMCSAADYSPEELAWLEQHATTDELAGSPVYVVDREACIEAGLRLPRSLDQQPRRIGE